MTWNNYNTEHEPEEVPVETTRYIALVGLTFDKPRKTRIKAGQEVPQSLLKGLDAATFSWLVGKRKAMREI